MELGKVNNNEGNNVVKTKQSAVRMKRIDHFPFSFRVSAPLLTNQIMKNRVNYLSNVSTIWLFCLDNFLFAFDFRLIPLNV